MITIDNDIIMASNPFFSGRISQELHDHIEEFRKQTGESKTDVLVRALAKYTEYELKENKPDIPPIKETFNDISNKFNSLIKRVEKLEASLVNDNTMIIVDNEESRQLSLDKLSLEKTLITNDNKAKTDNLSIQQIDPSIPSDVNSKQSPKIENETITNDNEKAKDNAENKNAQILSTKETVALVGKGCSSTSLHRWKRQDELPKIKNGYQIEDNGRGKWKTTKVDNN